MILVLFGIWVFMLGISIGSFLNVCIYRIPLHENVVVTNSHCMTCKHQLSWIDLFPLFSYLFLGGKCRYCKTRISIQYPIIELLNGLMYVLIFIMKGFTFDTVLYCLCTSALIVLAVIDWRTFEIPFEINMFILVLGIVKLIIDYRNWSLYLVGLVSVSGFLLLLFFITSGRGIGGGDIKLMAAAGLLLGWKSIILALIVGCVLGSIIHLCIMKIKKGDHLLAFGPYLSAGIFVAMLWGNPIIEWYLKTFVL